MQNDLNTQRHGSKLQFLSPSNTPHLKTSITKPQNVMLESVSPVYKRPLSNPGATSILDVYRAGFHNWTRSTDESGQENEETLLKKKVYKENAKGSSTEFHKRRRTFPSVIPSKKTANHAQTDHLETLPNEIIEEDFIAHDAADQYGHNKFSQIIEQNKYGPIQRDKLLSSVPLENQTNNAESTTYEGSQSRVVAGRGSSLQIASDLAKERNYTASFSSSCNSDDSVVAHSRCSMCDGCSSGTSCSGLSQLLLSGIPKVDTDNRNNFGLQSMLDMSPRQVEDLLDSHVAFDGLEETNWSATEVGFRHPSGNSSTAVHSKQSSMSTEQLIFLLLRMVLAKYKSMTDDLAAERRINSSQRKSVACLIQAVVLLSRKVKATSEQFNISQRKLKCIQERHRQLENQQKKLYFGICIIIVVNVCSINVVRERLKSIFRFFGIVENMRKINRTRKMIAENWRNIPSLLTDFWRIFIFHSRSDLKRS